MSVVDWNQAANMVRQLNETRVLIQNTASTAQAAYLQVEQARTMVSYLGNPKLAGQRLLWSIWDGGTLRSLEGMFRQLDERQKRAITRKTGCLGNTHGGMYREIEYNGVGRDADSYTRYSVLEEDYDFYLKSRDHIAQRRRALEDRQSEIYHQLVNADLIETEKLQAELQKIRNDLLNLEATESAIRDHVLVQHTLNENRESIERHAEEEDVNNNLLKSSDEMKRHLSGISFRSYL